MVRLVPLSFFLPDELFLFFAVPSAAQSQTRRLGFPWEALVMSVMKAVRSSPSSSPVSQPVAVS